MVVHLREKLHIVDTFTVGNEDIPRGVCVVLNNGVIEVSNFNNPKFVGFTVDKSHAGTDVLIAEGGSTVLALAGIGGIKEGDCLVSDKQGKVYPIYLNKLIGTKPPMLIHLVGYAHKEAHVEDQLIPVKVWPQIVRI